MTPGAAEVGSSHSAQMKSGHGMETWMELTQTQLDRARGVLLGVACGDALGAGYELARPWPTDPQSA